MSCSFPASLLIRTLMQYESDDRFAPIRQMATQFPPAMQRTSRVYLLIHHNHTSNPAFSQPARPRFMHAGHRPAAPPMRTGQHRWCGHEAVSRSTRIPVDVSLNCTAGHLAIDVPAINMTRSPDGLVIPSSCCSDFNSPNSCPATRSRGSSCLEPPQWRNGFRSRCGH